MLKIKIVFITKGPVINNMSSVRDRRQEFIDKARIVHGDKYEYDLVEYKKAKTKVKIKCSVHGVFEPKRRFGYNSSIGFMSKLDMICPILI
jgi:hypothetical protein